MLRCGENTNRVSEKDCTFFKNFSLGPWYINKKKGTIFFGHGVLFRGPELNFLYTKNSNTNGT